MTGYDTTRASNIFLWGLITVALLGVLLLSTTAGAATSGADEVYRALWHRNTGFLNGNTYAAIANNPVVNWVYEYNYVAKTTGGLAYMYYFEGSFVEVPIGSDFTLYTALAANSRANWVGEDFVAALDSGGIREVYYDAGAWTLGAPALTENRYVGLAYNSRATHNIQIYYAARSDGGVQEVYYDGGWIAGGIANPSTSYVAVTYNSKISYDQNFFCALSDGGLQEAYYDGTWQSSAVINPTVKYVSVSFVSGHDLDRIYYAARADGGVDEVYFGAGAWHVAPIDSASGHIYSSIAYQPSAPVGQTFLGSNAADGAGIEEFYYNPAWHNDSGVVTGTYYTALSNNPSVTWVRGLCYAARSTGGASYVYQEGGAWGESPAIGGDTTKYTSLTTNTNAAGWGAPEDFVATLESGGIREIYYYDGSWTLSAPVLTDNKYLAIAFNQRANWVQDFYAVRESGGIQEVYWSGSWAAGGIADPSTKYVALTCNADAWFTEGCFAALADGGLREVYYQGGWQVGGIINPTVKYVAVTTNLRDPNRDSYFAARADGGVDWVYYSGGWQIEPIAVTTGVKYVALANLRDPMVAYRDDFLGAIAVPATVEVADLASLKTMENGTPISVTSGKSITATFEGDDGHGGFAPVAFAIEEESRASGIRVLWNGIVHSGYTAKLTGTVTVVDGEAVIQATSVEETIGTPSIQPMGMQGKATAGGKLGLQDAVINDTFGTLSSGLNNVGLLMKIYGRVTSSWDTGTYDEGYFYVDDGSNLSDGSGYIGIKCRAASGLFGPGELPMEGSYVSVDGVMGVRIIGGNLTRFLWSTSWSY